MLRDGLAFGAGNAFNFRLRFSGPPLLPLRCLPGLKQVHPNARKPDFLASLAVPFLRPPGGPKNGTAHVPSCRFFFNARKRPQKWDRLAVPFLGPFLEQFAAAVAAPRLRKIARRNANVQLGRPNLPKPVFVCFCGPKSGTAWAGDGGCFVHPVGTLCLL